MTRSTSPRHAPGLGGRRIGAAGEARHGPLPLHGPSPPVTLPSPDLLLSCAFPPPSLEGEGKGGMGGGRDAGGDRLGDSGCELEHVGDASCAAMRAVSGMVEDHAKRGRAEEENAGVLGEEGREAVEGPAVMYSSATEMAPSL